MGNGFEDVKINDDALTEDISDLIIKTRRRGRPKQYEHGAKENEKLVKYSSKYYRENKDKKCICEFCDKEIVKIYKHQHLKSKTCQKIRELKESITK
jgi:hypothetical protein